MQDSRTYPAANVKAHGELIQRCLNGAMACLGPVIRRPSDSWESYSPLVNTFEFLPRYSYRCRYSEYGPVFESPSKTDNEIPYGSPEEYTAEQVKQWGAEIQHALNGGDIEHSVPGGDSRWIKSRSSATLSFYTDGTYLYRVVPPPFAYPPQDEVFKAAEWVNEANETTCSLATEAVKPAPDIIPQSVWIEDRITELRAAVLRQANYEKPNWKLVQGWVTELLELKEKL